MDERYLVYPEDFSLDTQLKLRKLMDQLRNHLPAGMFSDLSPEVKQNLNEFGRKIELNCGKISFDNQQRFKKLMEQGLLYQILDNFSFSSRTLSVRPIGSHTLNVDLFDVHPLSVRPFAIQRKPISVNPFSIDPFSIHTHLFSVDPA
jgi:hypothetical protein